MVELPIGYSVRLGIIRKVSSTEVECVYTDRAGELPVKCPIPHPAASKGFGVFVGYEKDTRVLLAKAPQEQTYIVGIIPERSYYFSQDGVSDSDISTPKYPELRKGEINIQGLYRSFVKIDYNGNILLDAGASDLESDIEISREDKSLYIRTNNVMTFNEAGRKIEGIVQRDISDKNEKEYNVVNFLSGSAYTNILSSIGRSPKDPVSLRTTTISSTIPRNPPLVEKREIIYEYADSFNAGNLEAEIKASEHVDEKNYLENINFISGDFYSRKFKRTDVLNLNENNYNHLIEKVQGTLVDIYGNVLDLNRNIITVPSLEEGNNRELILEKIYSEMRKSIKYHFEINSRKPKEKNKNGNSRWFIDVDAEGQTKINIPCSSETGNICFNGEYKNIPGQERENKKDVDFVVRNKNGVKIKNTKYSTFIDEQINLSTAHHNILETAQKIYEDGVLSIPYKQKEKKEFLSDQITNEDTDELKANAGGRSLSANLDGSIEMSIGADSLDFKSLTLDFAGGVVSRIGRDKNGRSTILQTDGDVIIQIGGTGVDDTRSESNGSKTERPGRIEIHLNRKGIGNEKSQKIIIDEKGVVFDVDGNFFINATGDVGIQSGGKLVLQGDLINLYGSIDTNQRKILYGESLVVRDGRKK